MIHACYQLFNEEELHVYSMFYFTAQQGIDMWTEVAQNVKDHVEQTQP